MWKRRTSLAGAGKNVPRICEFGVERWGFFQGENLFSPLLWRRNRGMFRKSGKSEKMKKQRKI